MVTEGLGAAASHPESRRTTVQSFMHRVEGIDWYCQQQGQGPTIVLVPSGEGDCTSFDPVAARLADRFSVLTFDMPGFSRTSAPPDPRDLTPVKAADQVAALLRSLGIDKATFYGCSSGGALVLLLIAEHADLVTNGVVHEVAIDADYRNKKSESLLPSLCALTDDEVVEQCKVIYREFMNDDPAAWDALGRGLPRATRAQLRDVGPPLRQLLGARHCLSSPRTSPNVRWNGRSADTPRP